MKKIYYLLLIFFISIPLKSQTNKIDSAEIKDLKARKEKLNKLLFQDLPKISLSESEKILSLYNEAEKITTPKLGNYIVFINNGRGRQYEKIGEFKKALNDYNKAYKTAVGFGDSMGSARALQSKAIYYGKLAKYDSCNFFLKKSIGVTKRNIYNPKVDSIQNKVLLATLLSNFGTMNLIQKNLKPALGAFEQVLPLTIKLKNPKLEMLTYGHIGGIYDNMNNHKRALEFFYKEKLMAEKLNDSNGLGFSLLHISSTLKSQKKYSEAEPLLIEAVKIFENLNDIDAIGKAKNHLFTLYRLKEDFKKVHEMEDEVLEIIKKGNNKEALSHFYVELGEIYTKEKNYSAAEKYLGMAEKIINENNYNKELLYRKYALLKESQGKISEALDFKTKELELSKERVSPDYINKISEFDTKYRVAEKDLKLKQQQLALKTKELQIANEKANRNYALSGIAVLFLLSGGGFLYFRNRKKREDLQKQNTMLSLQKNLNEMQLQNLNKQLNPHEVKNLLAGLSLEMQEKAPETYQNMVRFFNLTKASLYNDSLTESLDIQLKQAEDFISLEKQILHEPIDFEIDKNLKSDKVEIPRLLIKNLLENSVKHGIKGKENGGSILLKVFEDENFLNIEVDDTGKGRKMQISKDSGIGTTTYQKLFETLNKTNEKNASFEIFDKEVGTKVVVKIPLNYRYA